MNNPPPECYSVGGTKRPYMTVYATPPVITFAVPKKIPPGVLDSGGGDIRRVPVG